MHIGLNYLLEKTMILIADNMSPSDNKESLFGIEFDIDTPMNLEVKR